MIEYLYFHSFAASFHNVIILARVVVRNQKDLSASRSHCSLPPQHAEGWGSPWGCFSLLTQCSHFPVLSTSVVTLFLYLNNSPKPDELLLSQLLGT